MQVPDNRTSRGKKLETGDGVLSPLAYMFLGLAALEVEFWRFIIIAYEKVSARK
jgi:hypothetical protein